MYNIKSIRIHFFTQQILVYSQYLDLFHSIASFPSNKVKLSHWKASVGSYKSKKTDPLQPVTKTPKSKQYHLGKFECSQKNGLQM